MYIDEAGASTVVKVGCDAEKIGFVDIWWDADGNIQSSVFAVPATEFPKEPECEAFGSQQDAFVQNMMSAEIATLPTAMSSKRVRFEASDMATFLLTLLRRGQATEGVELVLLQGGAVRAKADYEPGPLLMGDLFKEIAFECHQAIIDVPGHIIAESIKNTRTMAKPAPNFLHTDEGVKINAEHEVLEIAAQPFEPDRVYRLSIYQMLLTGLNVIEPIYSYVVNNMPVPDEVG